MPQPGTALAIRAAATRYALSATDGMPLAASPLTDMLAASRRACGRPCAASGALWRPRWARAPPRTRSAPARPRRQPGRAGRRADRARRGGADAGRQHAGDHEDDRAGWRSAPAAPARTSSGRRDASERRRPRRRARTAADAGRQRRTRRGRGGARQRAGTVGHGLFRSGGKRFVLSSNEIGRQPVTLSDTGGIPASEGPYAAKVGFAPRAAALCPMKGRSGADSAVLRGAQRAGRVQTAVRRARPERPHDVGASFADQPPQRRTATSAGQECVRGGDRLRRARRRPAREQPDRRRSAPASLDAARPTRRRSRRSTFSTYGAISSPWLQCAKPAMTAFCIAFGSSSSCTASRHASAFASGVGCSARAVAAWRCPAADGSRSSSAAMSSSADRAECCQGREDRPPQLGVDRRVRRRSSVPSSRPRA